MGGRGNRFPAAVDGAVQENNPDMVFPKSASMWVLLLAILATITMLLVAYFLGGFETTYPPPTRSGCVQSTGTAA
jgi:hypothetical protein